MRFNMRISLLLCREFLYILRQINCTMCNGTEECGVITVNTTTCISSSGICYVCGSFHFFTSRLQLGPSLKCNYLYVKSGCILSAILARHRYAVRC